MSSQLLRKGNFQTERRTILPIQKYFNKLTNLNCLFRFVIVVNIIIVSGLLSWMHRSMHIKIYLDSFWVKATILLTTFMDLNSMHFSYLLPLLFLEAIFEIFWSGNVVFLSIWIHHIIRVLTGGGGRGVNAKLLEFIKTLWQTRWETVTLGVQFVSSKQFKASC